MCRFRTGVSGLLVILRETAVLVLFSGAAPARLVAPWADIGVRTHLTADLVVEHERHHHVHLILSDAGAVATDLVFFDPGTPNVAQSFGGARQSLLNGVLEALGRCGADLGHFGYGHPRPPCQRFMAAIVIARILLRFSMEK
jgi:hypothetical protein